MFPRILFRQFPREHEVCPEAIAAETHSVVPLISAEQTPHPDERGPIALSNTGEQVKNLLDPLSLRRLWMGLKMREQMSFGKHSLQVIWQECVLTDTCSHT